MSVGRAVMQQCDSVRVKHCYSNAKLCATDCYSNVITVHTMYGGALCADAAEVMLYSTLYECAPETSLQRCVHQVIEWMTVRVCARPYIATAMKRCPRHMVKAMLLQSVSIGWEL